MSTLIVKKLVRAALTLLICVTIVFVVLRSAGDPLRSLLPDDTPPDVVELYRSRLGLDKTMLEQYAHYLAGLARGDFGLSFVEKRPALDVVLDRVPWTVLLAGLALLIAIVVGLPLGILAAAYRNGFLDRLVMSVAVFGYSMPPFFLAIVLILIFSLNLRMLPSAGSHTWPHLLMPLLVLMAPPAAKIARFTRTAMLEVMRKDYLRTAYAKGAGGIRALCLHALPNAAIPVVTFVGFELGLVVGTGVVTETIFAWPGVGRLLVVSVAQRDLAVVQTIVLLIATTMVCANLLVDIAYGWLDPRMRALNSAVEG